MSKIRGLETVKLGFQADWINEMLAEVNGLLEFDVDVEGFLPLELRQRFLQFLESPTELFSFDSELDATGGAGECRIRLKPSDSFLNFLLALRAWNRNRKVTV